MEAIDREELELIVLEVEVLQVLEKLEAVDRRPEIQALEAERLELQQLIRVRIRLGFFFLFAVIQLRLQNLKFLLPDLVLTRIGHQVAYLALHFECGQIFEIFGVVVVAVARLFLRG